MTGPAESDRVPLWEEWHTKTKRRKNLRVISEFQKFSLQNEATWENEFYLPRNKHPMPSHSASPWNRGLVKLGNGPLESETIIFWGPPQAFWPSENSLITRVFFWIHYSLQMSSFSTQFYALDMRYNPLTPAAPRAPSKKKVRPLCDAKCVHHEKGVLSLGTKVRKKQIK